jgi:non-canonical (house-cleaning) NTP pyrophosphatase
VSFTDTSPDAGDTDNYSCVVTDTEGNTSAAGTASVTVPPSVLAAPSAPTLTAVYPPG